MSTHAAGVDPFAETEDQQALRKLARDVAERELAAQRPALGRDRGVPAGVVGRDAQGRPVRHHGRRAVRRDGHGRHRGRDRARGARPGRRVERDPRPAHLQRPAAGDRAPRQRRAQGALAAARGLRRGPVLHRHQRDRGRLRRQPHARPAHARRRRLPAQRLQELRHRRAQGGRAASCGAASRAARARRASARSSSTSQSDGVTVRRHPREDGAAGHERGRARLRRRVRRARGRAARAATRRTATRSRR